jgi:hypothetical protein
VELLAGFGRKKASAMRVAPFKNGALTEHQPSITDFWSCIIDYYWAVRQHYVIITVFAAFMGTKASADIGTTSSK